MSAVLIAALAALGQPAAAAPAAAAPEAPAAWIQPDPSTLRRVFGVRYTRSYADFELLKTNEEEWTVPLISPDGVRLYVGTRTGILEALDLATGESLWKRTDMGTLGYGMAEFRGRVLVGSDAALVGLDPQIGKEHWRVEIEGKLAAEMTVTGTVALLPVRPNTLVAVDLVEHKVLWRVKRPTPDSITVRGQCPAVIDAARGRVYVGFSDGTLVALDKDTGSTVWVAPLGTRKDFFADVDVAPILVDDGKALLTASYNGGLFKLDAETGNRIWHQPLGRITGLVRIDRGLLVASLGSGQVAALYEANGKVRWRYKVKKGYPSQPIALEHGLVAFAVSKGPITILDAARGRPVQLITPGSGMVVPPARSGDDMVALTNEGLLLVMRRGEGGGAAAR